VSGVGQTEEGMSEKGETKSACGLDLTNRREVERGGGRGGREANDLHLF